MAFGGMATPLGMKPTTSQRGVPPLWRWGMLALFFLCIALLLVLFGRKGGPGLSGPGVGGPGVVAVIERSAPPAHQPANPAPGPTPVSPRSDAAEIEARSGVTVIRQNGGTTPGGMVIKVPDVGDRMVVAPDVRVSERSQLGTLPRIGEGGLLPRVVYARPFASPGKPMIGVVMTGVGVSARGTADAITKLSGDVTLAFAPYGRDLEQQVTRARRDGHEILLQVPMEPLDYPDSDPGPHTLKVESTLQENVERLHWLMSRFSGYIGISNFMGSKLLGETAAYGNLLEEINRRGLVFLDDGTAPRSTTADASRKLGLPARIADRVFEIGGVKSLETVLAEIEEIARKKGSAIITIPALPANIDKVAAWERELSSRGVVLAPLSAMIGKPAR